MAIGWLAVLQSVPWADVISNAPMVADGAKKLWGTIAKKSPQTNAGSPIRRSPGSSEAQAIADLQARLEVIEAASADLHDQMLASSELIKTLAEQNTQLIKRIEVNRVRVIWLTVATVIIGIVAIFGLTLALSR